MFMYEKDNKLNLTFEKTVVPPETPDLVISKEDGITTVSIEGQASSLPQVTEENNGQTLIVQDGQWTLGQAGGNSSALFNDWAKQLTIPEGVYGIDWASLKCKNINELTLEEVTQIGPESLQHNPSLYSIIINTPTLCVLGRDAFLNTSITATTGWIYVPDNLVNDYKSATNWDTYADRIVGISEYPKEVSLLGTIDDSWEEIFAAEDDGTYSTKYSVGGTKVLDIGGTKVLMEIIAKDTDVLSDNSGNAKITWLSKQIPFMFPMNSADTIAGGWKDSILRKRLSEIVIEDIDSVVKNNIKAVNKTSYDYSTSATVTTSDTLWVPSAREVAITVDPMEDSGVVYSEVFSDNDSRIKNYGFSSNPAWWWLRSSFSGLGVNFRGVSEDGSGGGGTPSFFNGVALGFCT